MREILQILVFVVTRTSNSLCECTALFIVVPIRTKTSTVSAKNMALLRFQFSN